jgi:hypothetical protein
LIQLDFLIYDGCTLILTELSAADFSKFMKAHNSKQFIMVTFLSNTDDDSNLWHQEELCNFEFNLEQSYDQIVDEIA